MFPPQDYLDTIPMNHETQDDTCLSALESVRQNCAHCESEQAVAPCPVLRLFDSSIGTDISHPFRLVVNINVSFTFRYLTIPSTTTLLHRTQASRVLWSARTS